MIEATAARALSMPPDQTVEILVARRRGGPATQLPATYEGDYARGSDAPPRRLTDAEREAIARAGRLITDAFVGAPVDDLELNDAVELLHRLAGEVEGEPRFRLSSGQVIRGHELPYRAALG